MDSLGDACSICLDDFTAQDPATVTTCKHEYHLHCILEWSQRSKECPICWQSLALTDPVSQELLATVDIERRTRTRRSSTVQFISNDDFEFSDQNQVIRDTDYLDLEDRIMHHLAATSVDGQVIQLDRNDLEVHLMQHLMAASGNPQPSPSSVENESPVSPASPEAYSLLGSPTSSQMSIGSDASDTVNPRVILCQSPLSHPAHPQHLQHPESPSFSVSLRSKLFAVSSRCKETISKNTRGLKEKLLARNNSMKELSKEVTREVTAGVARMMERLEPNLKRSGSVDCASDYSVGTSEMPLNESNPAKNMQQSPEACVSSNVFSNAPDVVSSSKKIAYL